MKNNLRVLFPQPVTPLCFELLNAFARHGHPIVLTEDNGPGESGVATTLRKKFDSEVLSLSWAYRGPRSSNALIDMLKKKYLSINILVNIIAVGGENHTQNLPLEAHVSEVVTKSRLLVSSFLESGPGRILNVVTSNSSPSNRVSYHVMKGFVRKFNDILNTENNFSEVRSTCFTPPTARGTEFPDPVGTAEFRHQRDDIDMLKETAEAVYWATIVGSPTILPPLPAAKPARASAAWFSERRLAQSFAPYH